MNDRTFDYEPQYENWQKRQASDWLIVILYIRVHIYIHIHMHISQHNWHSAEINARVYDLDGIPGATDIGAWVVTITQGRIYYI